MAPFNTHFLVAEKIWPEVTARLSWPAGGSRNCYGQFCFGCVAPDVDKASTTLTQKDTHFFDRTGDYEGMAAGRTAAFLQHQAEFLGRPFVSMSPEAQAFILGYLCHLGVDEVSKHMWRRETWLQFHHIRAGSAFAALDEAARQHTRDYAGLGRAICCIEALDVIPRIPLADLKRLLAGTCVFVQAGNIEEEYLALVDLFVRPSPEERREKQAIFRAEIEQARQQFHLFHLDRLVEASLVRCRQRMADLIEGRVPEPDYPVLAG